jgi:CrcB protein
MLRLLLVGLGGGFGSILRYGTGGLVHRWAGQALFPWGTLVVNVLGCLLIGFLGSLSEARGVLTGEARLFLFIGILGGFTTFSTFGYETFQLIRDGQISWAAANALSQLGLGLAAVWAGDVLGRLL